MKKSNSSSRIPGFYKLSIDDRIKKIGNFDAVDVNNLGELPSSDSLSIEQANHMIENVIGIYSLPLGIGLNFLINDIDVLIPMVVEEPSVVAGASFMAKLVRAGGGFKASSDNPEMIGQLQLLEIEDIDIAIKSIEDEKPNLIELIKNVDPILNNLGGGPRDIHIRVIDDSPIGTFIVIHVIYDVRDAMGANAVNTACEVLAPEIEEITGGKVHLRILSNLADHRLAKAECVVPVEKLAFGEYSGEEVRDGIISAWAFAASDPYRAATHNKGIMNGVDAVVLATGNDWRAVEAGAHAFAARTGVYTSLSTWGKDDDGNLVGILEMPMAVGIVGGATKVHPSAQASIKLMGVESAKELAEIIVSVGLAQNLAALRALATEGIQKGHMGLHARQVAIAAGAVGKEIEKLAIQLVKDKTIRIDRAEEILSAWSENGK